MSYSKYLTHFVRSRTYLDDELDEESCDSKPSTMIHVVDFEDKVDFRLYILLSVCLLIASGVGYWFQTREAVTTVRDFYEPVPQPQVTAQQKSKTETPPQKVSVAKTSVDPRSRVTHKGMAGLISGQIKGKQASPDIFGKGGFASDIDAVISGVGGIKAGGGNGVGRRGLSGIGYGAGYGSGFGGGSIASMRVFEGNAALTELEMNTEEYSHIAENGFKEALSSPLSTFSIDVDVASYSNVRRFLSMESLPPPDAVRIEEMINYFSYDYDPPVNEHPFSITTEVAVCPWEKSHKLVLVGLQGKIVDKRDIPPSNLVFLIDVSGSMGMPNKLPLVKQSLWMLVEQLREEDRVSIVVYAGAAGLVLPSTSGSEKSRIGRSLDKLEAGGSTAGGHGIALAYKVARENLIKNGNNRVILATDGDFNVGVSSDGELVRMIEKERENSIFLTVLGFGMGNYKDSKMEQLADKGNGNYAYIDNLTEARKVFVEQMAGTLLTIAKDVKVQVEFNPALVAQYRLIGYENRVMAKEDFNDDKKDAGELGAGHSVTALYEIVPVGSNVESYVDELKYQSVNVSDAAYRNGEMMTVKLRYKKPNENESRLLTHVVMSGPESTYLSDNLGFASAVAGFGMILRGSEHKGSFTVDDVLQQARVHIGNDRFGYRQEFVSLVKKYSGLRRS